MTPQDYPIPGGIYRHYKGGLYQVLNLSKHTETDEILVNYKSLHFGSFYSRPLDSWNKSIEGNQNGQLKRFVLEK
jgi:hypothetical protein